MRILLAIGVLCSFVWVLPCASAEEAGPPQSSDTQQTVDDFMKLLEGLQDDPAARASVKQVLIERLDAVRKEAADAKKPVDAAAAQVDEARKKAGELETRIADLSKQIEAAKGELDQVQGALPELTLQLGAAQDKQTEITEKLAVYERSLELVNLLDQNAPAAEADTNPESAAAPEPKPAASPAVPPINPEDRVNFNKDIRPILANNCFACHGPDDKTRKAGLHLDTEEGATKPFAKGGAAIIPGDRAGSEVWKRITTENVDDRMPPAEFEKTLNEQQIELLGKWIEQGGRYEKHWAFVPPVRSELPEVAHKDWPKNEIDYFILSRLEREGLTPSSEADKRTLIRRVTLDLTGLPPTPEEVEAFVANDSPDAYENLVDRLLASPRYGEQMARDWLDAARYADTNGYHIDNIRYMWRWRDWVINAFNRDMPFDEFTIEQLAGDLLPDPTVDQRIATGFNRNHMITFEGGIIPEEYRVQYVIDRLNTTGTVWMGLTVGCAQCHDHKFDPISNKEFYQLFAFFNSIPEKGSDGTGGNAVPLIKAPLPQQREKLDALHKEMEMAVAELNAPAPELDAAQAAWESEASQSLQARWTVLNPETATSSGGATLKTRIDRTILVEGENPEKDVYEVIANTNVTGITGIRVEALADPSLPNGGTGRSDNSNFVLTEFEAEVSPVDNPDLKQRVTFTAAVADFSQPDYDVAKAIDGNAESGWAVDGGSKEDRVAVFVPDRPFGFDVGTRVHLRLHHESKFTHHAMGSFRLAVTTDPTMSPSQFGPWYLNGPYLAEDGKTAYETAYDPEQGVDLAATYDDHRVKWVLRSDLKDGAIQELSGDVCATYFYREITAPSAREMTLSVGSNDAIKIWLNDAVVHDQNVQRGVEANQDQVTLNLVAGPNRLLMKVVNYGNAYAYYFRRAHEEVGEIPLSVERALAIPAEGRTDKQVGEVREYYRSRNWPEWEPLSAQLAQLREQEKVLEAEIPTTMVMQEMETPRETFVLARGQYDQPREKVTAAVPAALPPLAEDAPGNRLGFAEWLVDASHPLTARVAVNRYWMHYFGTGIVKTAEDFGVQGEWPSHPQLLDWLATEFARTGWNVKAMQKLLVMSATYRQLSKVPEGLLDKDPENRLLARGPRFRMDAEMVRDNALAVSGLLVKTIGGPSVKPYQPIGLWEEVSYGGTEFTGQVFEQDHGEALYRRSMYTFWKRQSPPPGMLIFDAPNREVCTARRARTNTPLQALALMNDTQYVEAARVLAQRMLKEAGPEPQDRVAYAFELATARPPKPEEAAVLVQAYQEQLETYRNDQEAAQALVNQGEAPRDESLDVPELAAWSTVASIILNLDETITKS